MPGYRIITNPNRRLRIRAVLFLMNSLSGENSTRVFPIWWRCWSGCLWYLGHQSASVFRTVVLSLIVDHIPFFDGRTQIRQSNGEKPNLIRVTVWGHCIKWNSIGPQHPKARREPVFSARQHVWYHWKKKRAKQLFEKSIGILLDVYSHSMGALSWWRQPYHS